MRTNHFPTPGASRAVPKQTGRRSVPFSFDAEAKTYSATASSTPVSGTATARLLSFSRIRADLPERSRR